MDMINIGAAANDGTGETLRAVGAKLNRNFKGLLNARAGAARRVLTIGTSLVGLGVYCSVAGKKMGFSARDWMAWARWHSKGRLSHTVWYDDTFYGGWEPSGTAGAVRGWQGLNAGVPGQTYAQIVARLPFIEANFLDMFDVVVMDCGTNDMTNGAKEDILAARETVAAFFASRGKLVLMTPLLARGVSAWAAGSAARAKANWLNAKARAFCNTTPNCFLWNWNEAFQDGANANGEPRAGFSNDGTHFALPGGEAVGLHLVNFLDSLGVLPPAQPRTTSPDDKHDAVNNPLGSLLTDGMMLATAGTFGTGASGVLPTGFLCQRSSGTGTIVASIEPRGDGRGKNAVLTITPGGAASDETFIMQQGTITHPGAGAWLDASCEVEVNAADTVSAVTLELWDETNSWIMADMARYEAEQATILWPAKARSGRLHTPPLQMGAGSTKARWRLSVTLRGTPAVNPVIKIGCADLRPVADPRPAYPLIVPAS